MERIPFSWFCPREREREKERRRRVQASLYNLRSSVGKFLAGQGQKFIASMRGTRGYLEPLRLGEGRLRLGELVTM